MKKYFFAFIMICVFGPAVSAADFDQRAYECVATNEIFASTLYRAARLKKDLANNPKASYNPVSSAIGYIHHDGNTRMGAAFNYEYGNRKLRYRDSGYKIRTNISGFSVFGGLHLNESTYVNAHAFLGFATYKAENGWSGANHLGRGNRNHKTMFAVGMEAGKMYSAGFGGLIATPHIGFDYAYMPSEHYDWSPSGVSDGITSQSYFEIPLGVSLSRPVALGGWNLVPKVDATLITSLGKMDPYNAHPGVAFRTIDAWKVAGVSAGRIGYRLSAGVDTDLTKSVKAGIGYAFENRSGHQDHRLNASLSLAF